MPAHAFKRSAETLQADNLFHTGWLRQNIAPVIDCTYQYKALQPSQTKTGWIIVTSFTPCDCTGSARGKDQERCSNSRGTAHPQGGYTVRGGHSQATAGGRSCKTASHRSSAPPGSALVSCPGQFPFISAEHVLDKRVSLRSFASKHGVQRHRQRLTASNILACQMTR